MTKIEMIAAEEVDVHVEEQQECELSLAELDMVGGGSMCVNL
jgi:hypothetical protein